MSSNSPQRAGAETSASVSASIESAHTNKSNDQTNISNGESNQREQSDPDEEFKLKSIHVTIRPGTAREFPVSVYPGCTVEWKFTTRGGDISFVVFLEPDNGQIITLLEKKRYKSRNRWSSSAVLRIIKQYYF